MTADGSDVAFFSYTFPAGNNGNISGQYIQYGASPSYGSKNFQQNYTYDGANRLLSVNENTGWSQAFGYDAAGNRWLSTGAQLDATTPLANVYTPNNQFNATGYDARGNQTQDAGFTFQYDAENRLISSSSGGATLAAYAYDADGRRVTKVFGSATTTYVYDVAGELSAEYTVGASTPCAATCYVMADQLGSTRMQTDAGGHQIRAVRLRAVWGGVGIDGRPGCAMGGVWERVHFTGKEQEGYEGAYMHYFGARYFGGALGRFTPVDPSRQSVDSENPQTWNRYAYALNNPLAYVDRNGLWPSWTTIGFSRVSSMARSHPGKSGC